MGSSIPKPEYERASGVTALAVLLLLLLFTASGLLAGGWSGAFSAFVGFIIMLATPVLVWSVVLPRCSEKFFEVLVVKRKFELQLRRLRVKVPPHSEYFRVEPRFPTSSTWRFFQIVSIVIIAASYLTLLLRGLFPLSSQEELLAFFLIAFATLTVGVPVIVGILWVYQDAGVRRIDRESSTIAKVGTPLEQFFVGFGFASAFARFVFSLQGDPAGPWGIAGALLILLLPICAFVVVYFHTEYYAGVIEKFLNSEVGTKLPRKNIVLEPT